MSREEYQEIEKMFTSVTNFEEFSMLVNKLREKFGAHEAREENPIEYIFNQLQKEFPNPEKADLRDIVGFVMDMLKDIAPELGPMERQMIRERLESAGSLDEFVNMIHGMVDEFEQGGHGQDHGPGGMGDMSEMFDPERLNQPMMEAIPELMQGVMQRAMEIYAENPNFGPQDILDGAKELEQPLIDLGVTEEEMNILG
jgi:hypothetical protein